MADLGAVVATVGLGALSLQGDFSIRWGDAITLLGTLFYALHIMTTGFFAPKVHPSTLAVTQMIVSTAALARAHPLFATSRSICLGRCGRRSCGRP